MSETEEKKPDPITRQFRDLGWGLGFTVVATPYSHYVEYKIYEIIGQETPNGKLLYQRKDAHSSPQFVETIEEAEVFIEGSVKWDHCSDWDFDNVGHFCDKESIMNVSKILAACFDWTAELCESWDD